MVARESVCWEVAGYRVSVVSALSYFVDWLTYVVMLWFAITWGSFVTPLKIDFSVRDVTIMHKYVPENETYAPVWYLLIMVMLWPLLLIAVCCYLYLRNKNKERMLWDIHQAVLGSFGAIVSQLLLVVVIKNTAGIPRPDFISRCKPDYNIVLDLQLATEIVCMEPDKTLLDEGFRSFPSGHSSTVFASQTFLALFLIGKTKMDASHYFSWKILVSVLYPLTVGLKISFSRIADNRHRIGDVVVGDMIGLLSGLGFYFLYFTNPFTAKMSVAICPRKFEIIDSFTEYIKFEISMYNIDENGKDMKYTESINESNCRILPRLNNISHRPIHQIHNARPHTVNGINTVFQV